MADGDLAAIAGGYDELAANYEDQLARNPVARYMRARLHSHFSAIFGPGDRILDLGAGTGIDACFLASRGIQVIAVDVSSGMIAQLRRSAGAADLHIQTHVLPVEHLAQLELSGLDGAISAFGGLNTFDAIATFGGDLAACLRPGGRVILHALSDFCFWQTLRLLAHGHLEITRKTEIRLGSTVIAHHFYNPRALWRNAFAEYFAVRQIYALSIVAAPTLLKRFPSAERSLCRLDSLAGRVFSGAGDFFVLDMEKRIA